MNLRLDRIRELEQYYNELAQKEARRPPSERQDEAHLKHRLKRYKLTPKEYRDLLVKQKGMCAICGNKSHKRKLGVDHDHKTKKVRGLLCVNCNLGLGNFQDSLDFLAKAIEYLRKAQQ